MAWVPRGDWFGIRWVLIKIVIAVAVIVTDPLLVARGAHVAALSGDTPSWLTGPTVAHVVVLGVATVLSVFERARPDAVPANEAGCLTRAGSVTGGNGVVAFGYGSGSPRTNPVTRTWPAELL